MRPPEHVQRAPGSPAARPWRIPSKRPTRLLFAVANSSTQPINAGPEESAVRQALRDAEQAFVVETEPDLRAEDLFGLIRRHRPEIVHFSGHGHGRDGLAMKDRDNRPTTVDARELDRLCADLAASGVHLRCVVLNACLADEQARTIARWADFVVGTASLVADDAAVVFARTFYERLASGIAVPDAFDAARLRCARLGGGVFRLFYSEPAAPPPPKPSRRLLVAAGALGLVGGTGIVWHLLSTEDEDERPPTGAPREPDAVRPSPDAKADAATPDATPPPQAITPPLDDRPAPDAAHRRRRTPSRPEPTATVRITSKPSGASVFDGGRDVGRTPVNVPAGSLRRVRLELEGFDPGHVTVEPGRTPATVELRPAF